MASQSIPAHEAATDARLREAATCEARLPSEITASSQRFYLALPAVARAVLRDIDALGTDVDRHNLTRAIARTVSSAQYEVARRLSAEEMRLENEECLLTDEDTRAEAVLAIAEH